MPLERWRWRKSRLMRGRWIWTLSDYNLFRSRIGDSTFKSNKIVSYTKKAAPWGEAPLYRLLGGDGGERVQPIGKEPAIPFRPKPGRRVLQCGVAARERSGKISQQWCQLYFFPRRVAAVEMPALQRLLLRQSVLRSRGVERCDGRFCHWQLQRRQLS